MVATNKILLPECTGEGCGGGMRNPPREARLHACSPVYFLLSPFCRRSRAAGPRLTPSRKERPDVTIKRKDLIQNYYRFSCIVCSKCRFHHAPA